MTKSDLAKAQLLDLSRGMRSRMMASARESIKQSMVDDPDIWRCARSITEAAVEQFLIDLEREVECALENAVFQTKDETETPGPEGGTGAQNLYFWVRAKVLNHYLPFNRSIYGKFKDPMYLLMYLATLIPIHGIRVAFFSMILAMLVNPGPPDEHQLINFILIFKGMQFITSGIIYMAKGSMQYYSCHAFQKHDMLACVEVAGPGAAASFGQLLDYLGSVILVWVAFAYLPHAKKYTQAFATDKFRASLLPSHQGDSRSRLRKLLYYDVACFTLSILCLSGLTYLTCKDSFEGGLPTLGTLVHPLFHENIYWSCVLYSMLSLPFSLFSIPGLQKVLTHSNPTGYNRHGACVTFALRTAEQAAAPASASSGGVADVAARFTASVLRTAAKGRTARGGEQHGEYRTGDLARGLWSNVAGALGPKAAAVAQEPERCDEVVSQASTPRGLARGWGRVARQARMLVRWEAAADSPSLPAGAALPVAAVRLVPGASEMRKGSCFFLVEAAQDGSLDGACGEPWVQLRRHEDFAALAGRLDAKAARLGQRGRELPEDTARGGTWHQLEVQRRELERWLEGVFEDPRSQGVWASDLRDFFGIVGHGGHGDSDVSPGRSSGPLSPEAMEQGVGEIEGRSRLKRFVNTFRPRGTLAPDMEPAKAEPPAPRRGSKREKLKGRVSDAMHTMQNLWEFIEPPGEPAYISDVPSSPSPHGSPAPADVQAASPQTKEPPRPSTAAPALPPPLAPAPAPQLQNDPSQTRAPSSGNGRSTQPHTTLRSTNPFESPWPRAALETASSLRPAHALRHTAIRLEAVTPKGEGMAEAPPPGHTACRRDVPTPASEASSAPRSLGRLAPQGDLQIRVQTLAAVPGDMRAMRPNLFAPAQALPSTSTHAASGAAPSTSPFPWSAAQWEVRPPTSPASLAAETPADSAAHGSGLGDQSRPLLGEATHHWRRDAAATFSRVVAASAETSTGSFHEAASDKGRRALTKLGDTSERMRSRFEHLKDKNRYQRHGS